MKRKLLIGVLIVIVLGLVYFVPTQSDSVNTGQAFSDQSVPTPTGEQTAEPTDTAPAPAASQTTNAPAASRKVDTTQLNDVDASLNDDLDGEVDGSL